MAETRTIEKLPAKPYLRPSEIAEYLDLSVQTVYQMIAEGVIPAVRTAPRAHGHYRIPRDKFLSAIENNLSYSPEF